MVKYTKESIIAAYLGFTESNGGLNIPDVKKVLRLHNISTLGSGSVLRKRLKPIVDSYSGRKPLPKPSRAGRKSSPKVTPEMIANPKLLRKASGRKASGRKASPIKGRRYPSPKRVAPKQVAPKQVAHKQVAHKRVAPKRVAPKQSPIDTSDHTIVVYPEVEEKLTADSIMHIQVTLGLKYRGATHLDSTLVLPNRSVANKIMKQSKFSREAIENFLMSYFRLGYLSNVKVEPRLAGKGNSKIAHIHVKAGELREIETDFREDQFDREFKRRFNSDYREYFKHINEYQRDVEYPMIDTESKAFNVNSDFSIDADVYERPSEDSHLVWVYVSKIEFLN